MNGKKEILDVNGVIKQDEPLVTIILTLFNNENSVVETVKSILNQTYENLEILITNNASTDTTMQLIQKYIRSDCRIRILEEDAIETVYAEKEALIKSKGKYITFANPGKLMSPYYIEYMIANIQKYKAQIVTCDFFSISLTEFFSENQIRKKSPPEKIEKLTTDFYIKNLYSKSEHVYQECIVKWNKLIDKKWLLSTQYIRSLNTQETSYEILENPGAAIVTSNQFLICDVKFDGYYEERCFTYEHLDKIKFLESLILKAKKENSVLAMYNVSLRLLKFLLKVRTQLSFYNLVLYDKKELRKRTDLKFNSIYKFLVSKYPGKNVEYEQYNREYRELVKFERFRAENFFLYPEYTQDYPTELYD